MMDDFQALRISIASPQQILAWSRGEVKKPETINYRTHRAEVDGLMDERIFGPSKNYECYCGKYKKIRYRGIVCDQCGVEITSKRVRRERMGHIKLACPVTHVWFAYGIPNKLSLILNTPQKKLETVIYYARYLVTEYSEDGKKEALEIIAKKYDTQKEVLKEDLKKALEEKEDEFKESIKEQKKKKKNKKKLELAVENLKAKEKKELAKIKSIYKQKEANTKKKLDTLKDLVSNLREGTTLSEEEYNQLVEYDIDFFDLGMGAEAIRKLLNKLDLEKSMDEIMEAFKKTRSKAKKGKLIQRLRVVKGMKKANIDPSWLVLDVVPVLPPDLRPIIQLPGGRFATSDLNDLYRRVINRNNRLKRLMRLGAPEIILRNEKRMLQEAVDALIDNSHRPGNAVLNSRNQAYKSLSDMLRGKQGRFRQNLLGKRVDYSGRSVIISGPSLNIYECGIPKTMALELFKPFVLSEIIKEGLALNIKSAKLFYDAKSPEVWDILERVTKKHPVLLNRAPTLHKQGIQAFFPVLIEGDAIQIHPMICKGFNADFDGDQMAVHVPLTQKAKEEVLKRMMVDSNILLMADGTSVVNTEKDMALGVYYLTAIDKEEKNKEFKYFSSPVEAEGMFDLEKLKLHERIKVLVNGKLVETSVGRIIFNEVLPEGFRYVNEQLDKKKVARLSEEILDKYGSEEVVGFLDDVKTLGFKFATKSGISVSFNDFVVSKEKEEILDEVSKKEDQYTQDYYMGLLAPEEKKRLVEEAWMEAIDKIADVTWEKYNEKENNLVMLNESGATPVANPLRQISGVKGLILDPQGKIVELPLRSNYREGLSTLEYFVAARGTRKGLADTALKTAESGYLTRRLVDVAQDVITRVEDCGVEEGIVVERDANRRLSFGRRLHGRFLTQDVIDEETGEVILKAGNCVGIEEADEIDQNENIKKAYVRSPLKCKALRSVCQKCYGHSLGTGKLVDKGIAVGIIAAQSMGEAATQLTLDTKHLAGRAGTDITQGLPRVEELFEARTPKGKAELSPLNGKIKVLSEEGKNKIEIVITNDDEVVKNYLLKDGDKPKFKRSKKVKKGDVVIVRKNGKEIKVPEDGRVSREDNKIILETKNSISESISVDKDAVLIVKDGDKVKKGQQLTEGSIDPKELMELVDLDTAQHYIIDNIQETYGVQGIGIDDRHVEVVVRQMSRFARIRNSGDSEYLPNEYKDAIEIELINEELKNEGKNIITARRELLGITTAAVRTESFLSAASFQEQVRVLTDAALIGKVDELRGLKENVIIGKPVPLGDELEGGEEE
ncbi:DNA-directed RNA polymerase subunit beta' [Candidatus Dojkabacteria bacterium]|nr:DNA-directed RNA polymerase subunit beta' [Candidatus Dojkabacteria bacterium]